jgi:hypothetical protein
VAATNGEARADVRAGLERDVGWRTSAGVVHAREEGRDRAGRVQRAGGGSGGCTSPGG